MYPSCNCVYSQRVSKWEDVVAVYCAIHLLMDKSQSRALGGNSGAPSVPHSVLLSTYERMLSYDGRTIVEKR